MPIKLYVKQSFLAIGFFLVPRLVHPHYVKTPHQMVHPHYQAVRPKFAPTAHLPNHAVPHMPVPVNPALAKTVHQQKESNRPIGAGPTYTHTETSSVPPIYHYMPAPPSDIVLDKSPESFAQLW